MLVRLLLPRRRFLLPLRFNRGGLTNSPSSSSSCSSSIASRTEGPARGREELFKPPLLVRSKFRIAINDALGDLSQLRISLSFFVKRISKKRNDTVLAEKLCEGTRRSGPGDLVVLHLLGNADNESVATFVPSVQLPSALIALNEG